MPNYKASHHCLIYFTIFPLPIISHLLYQLAITGVSKKKKNSVCPYDKILVKSSQRKIYFGSENQVLFMVVLG